VPESYFVPEPERSVPSSETVISLSLEQLEIERATAAEAGKRPRYTKKGPRPSPLIRGLASTH
jgi:hypothetical protein